jgi:hypothetical protein
MKSMGRDLEQALTGLGLCPSPSGLTPSRYNDLLEAPHEFSGRLDVPGLERRYSYGESGHPQGSDSEFSPDPRIRGAQRNSDAYRTRGQGSGSLDGGVCSPSMSCYYDPGDFDSSDSEPWFRPPSRDSYLGLDSLRRSARSRTGWGTTQASGRERQLVEGPQLGSPVRDRGSGQGVGEIR